MNLYDQVLVILEHHSSYCLDNELERQVVARTVADAIDPTAQPLQMAYGGYWGEHPDYPRTDWASEVWAGDTNLGYWAWVSTKLS